MARPARQQPPAMSPWGVMVLFLRLIFAEVRNILLFAGATYQRILQLTDYAPPADSPRGPPPPAPQAAPQAAKERPAAPPKPSPKAAQPPSSPSSSSTEPPKPTRKSTKKPAAPKATPSRAHPSAVIPKAAPTRTLPTLPAEVFIQIISHLRRPLPPPNGRNPRSAIRQPELAVMMRVSKLMNNLAARPLYSTVIIDHLDLFTQNIGTPRTVTGIRSKAQLVSLTRSLFLEYAARPEPTYQDIMRVGQDVYDIICPDRLAEAALCIADSILIKENAAMLKPCISLTSISCSIYLGASPYDWQSLIDTSPIPDFENYVFDASMAVSALSASPYPSYLCDRGLRGPLASQPSLFPSGYLAAKHQGHATHIEIDTDLSRVPVRMSGHSDFYFTYDRHGEPGFEAGIKTALTLARGQMRAREFMREIAAGAEHHCEEHRVERLDSESLSLTFYVPGYWLSHVHGRDVHLELANLVKEFRVEFDIPHSSYASDSFRLKTLEEARPCGGCLWSPEDI